MKQSINTQNQLLYFHYNRKSSESEDKQVLSNEAQIAENQKIIRRQKLNVIGEPLQESRSAKEAGRPVFNEMLARIEKGEANAIICWKLDRLARNFIDGGKIIDLLQRGIIQEIITHEKVYLPSDNVLMMALEFGMANQFVRDLSVSVKRGLRMKAEMGYPSGVAKIAYLNDKTGLKGEKIWHEDSLRFPLVKQLFELFLSGKYSVIQLHKISIDKLHITTLERRKEGGKPISLSYLYRMLSDPIYAGFFYLQEEKYTLNRNLKRIITETEYWKIQEMLGRKGRPKSQKREALYNHFMQCADCGGATTPDFKFQIICPTCKQKFSYLNTDQCSKCEIKITKMKNPTYLTYVYYYCVKRKKQGTCTKGGVKEDKIDELLQDSFENDLAISPELSQWCIDNFMELEDKDLDDHLAIAKAREVAEENIKKKIDRLLDLRLSKDTLSLQEEELYNDKEKQLEDQLQAIQEQKKRNPEMFNWKEKTERRFSLMSEIIDIFENGSFDDKKEALSEIGSNLELKGNNVVLSYPHEVQLFINALKQAKVVEPRFEPRNMPINKDKDGIYAACRPTLLPSPKLIIILEDWEYMREMKEGLLDFI